MDRESVFTSATLSRTNVIRSTPQPLLDSLKSREARRIISLLRDAGFVAYLAGGCVRDALLGREPKDYDVATNATPESVRDLFGMKQTLAFGASFGVIGVLPPRNSRDQENPIEPTEVATFRSDGAYSDGRRPDSVRFGDAKEDAFRRDFTINGLFYDPHTQKVIDYVDGQADLRQGVLRTIGEPLDRFGEDKLRMLRAVRFATILEFEIDPDTLAAIRQHADEIAVVSGERIGAEMRRVLIDPDASRGLQRLAECRLAATVLPELDGADLSRHRSLISHAIPCDFPIALACLIAVAQDQAVALRGIARRWKLSNDETRKVTAALEHWETVSQSHGLPWSVVQPVLINRDVETIVALAVAVVATDQSDPRGIAIARESLQLSLEKLNPPRLITGNDLSRLGIPPGPQFRSILQSIRDAQLEGTIKTHDEAIKMVEKIKKS